MLRLFREKRIVYLTLRSQTGRLCIGLDTFVFWISFVQCYLLTGILHSITRVVGAAAKYKLVLGVLPLILLLVPYYGLLVNRVLVSALMFTGVILLSALANQTPLVDTLALARVPLTIYLVYYLIRAFLNSKERAERVIHWLYLLAVVQLPIVVLERVFYDKLPESWKYGSTGTIDLADFAGGTLHGDAALSFFLNSLVILLLFCKPVRKIIKRSWFLGIWLTLTIFLSESKLNQITAVLTWGIFLMTRLKLKTIILVVVTLTVLVSGLSILTRIGAMVFPWYTVWTRFEKELTDITNPSQRRVESFLQGGHARGAATYYYLHQPIKWFGEGPSASYNSVTRQRTIGNWGQIYVYYYEIGIIGLLSSILYAFTIAFGGGRRKLPWTSTLFLALMLVSATADPFNDIAIMFTYCLMLAMPRVLLRTEPVAPDGENNPSFITSDKRTAYEFNDI